MIIYEPEQIHNPDKFLEISRELAKNNFSLDVGCGFTEGVQKPVYANISLDLNMNKVSPEFLRKLKLNESHPICASACDLPFRSELFDRIFWRAILEHIPKPETAIIEGKRVLKENGKAEIILPIITAHMRHYLIIIWTQFPFSLWTIVVALWRAHLYWGIEGVPHLTDIKPEHLDYYFKEVRIIKRFYRHKWFQRPWSKITSKLVNGRYIKDIQGQFEAICRK
jgi:ubiquinone/menaquinone biosynthesis C-methylase UbiE